MDREELIREKIRPFLPAGAEQTVAAQIVNYRFRLTITGDRTSKSGDYRHPMGEQGHRISVNGTLNPYAFLITYVHELAHLITWERHRNNVRPHGKEWKQAFQEQMQPFLRQEIFPPDILGVLRSHMRNPKAATVRDTALVKALRNHDRPNGLELLGELPTGAEFSLSRRVFVKGEKLRTRYRCTEKSTQRVYLISSIAEVKRH